MKEYPSIQEKKLTTKSEMMDTDTTMKKKKCAINTTQAKSNKPCKCKTKHKPESSRRGLACRVMGFHDATVCLLHLVKETSKRV